MVREVNPVTTLSPQSCRFIPQSCCNPLRRRRHPVVAAVTCGVPQPTNKAYAIAQIAGIKLCESYNRQYGQNHGIDYRSAMPTNLYGPMTHRAS